MWTLLASAALSLPSWGWSPLTIPSLKNQTLSFDESVILTYPADSLSFTLAQVKEQTKFPLEKLGLCQLVVITPAEWQALKLHLRMEEVRTVSQKSALEKSTFRPVCLKKVSSYMPKGAVESFYVEGIAPKLLHFRRELWRLYMSRGGKPEDFTWKRWTPYVLVGTTNAKLHDEDQPHREKDVPCLTTVKTSK